MRDKDKVLTFRVNQKELDRINAKREEIGIRNMGAYLRKMAMDGYCVNLELKDVKELVRLLRICSNNLNQYAKKANETGNIYREDISDLQVRFASDTYGRILCAGLLRHRMVHYHAGGRKRETGGLHQSIKENGMDRAIMEDYYDQKYGENMEKNPWEELPEYQELLGKQTRIEDAIRGLLGDEYHRVWQLYEDVMSVQFAMEEVGIKYMYLQGAEDRERMLR